jgi:hypothetical protein
MDAAVSEERAVFEHRVSKYDPCLRDQSRPEWTSVSDIGRSFAGAVLTQEEYRRVEDAALAFFLRVFEVIRRQVRPVGGANKKKAGRQLQGRTWDEMPASAG